MYNYKVNTESEKNMQNYNDTVKILTSSGKFHINLGLERITKILELLGNPQDSLKCIHVAGTNGKGSVCAIIASILKEAGIKTGLYTSPHIFKYTERIKINNNDIPDEIFSKYVEYVCSLADNNNIDLTEFEIITAVMFKYFYDENVEVAVVETGLGGRFDATNVIKTNLCSIITHIDLDHTDRLGNTKDKIAFEKAGIIKPNCPIITSEGYEAIKDRADECNSLLILVSPFEDTSKLALKGNYQQENLSLALSAIKYLFPNIKQEIILNGLKNVQHPCRFQFIEEKMLVIDGAQNPNGATALKESLDSCFPNNKRCFIFGCLTTKDYPKMMKILFNQNDDIYFYHFNNQNSATFETLQNACEYKANKFISFDKLKIEPDTLIVICGSFYMLNEILPQLGIKLKK